MIKYITGNILKADAEAIVNTVNCVGVMGRGIALQFKNAFPANFKAYKTACDHGELQPGSMFVFDTGSMINPRYIINFPTKRHWRGKSRLEDIDSGLLALREVIQIRHITSIAIPPLGSGLGGLQWPDVRERIAVSLAGMENVAVTVYEPCEDSLSEKNVKSNNVPKMTEGRAALVGLMDRYLGGLLDPHVTLLEVHKLMYFMQIAGQNLRLQYRKWTYGPYAENLRHVLRDIEGHLISGYEDGGDSPDKQLKLVPKAREDALMFLEAHQTTNRRLDMVTNLVEGFETPFGMELLATVHWVAANENVTTLEDVAHAVHQWNDRKHQFSKHQISLALNRLHNKGWLTVETVA